MAKPKTDLQKHTLNLRPGDFQKMGELFPQVGSSESIRLLVSRFVDKHYKDNTAKVKVADVSL